MAVTTDKPAPYAPPRTVLEVVSRHRARGLNPPINAELLARIGVTDSLIPRTLQTLTALDLIDDQGMPTETFESLHLAPEAEYQARMANWLNAAYADVLTIIDPATASDTQVRDAFRPFSPRGQQDRMVTLFNGLYAAAGIRRAEVKEPRPRPVETIRKTAPRPIRTAALKLRGEPPTVTVTGLAGLPPLLTALLGNLPKPGNGWTKAQRDRVVNMFPTVLDFAYPIVEKQEEELEPEE